MKEIKTVLVIKLEDLSEFVLSLAAMQHIRQAHPKAHITLLTTPPFEALAKASPYFNAIDTSGGEGGFADLGGVARKLKRARFDRVYDLENSKRSNRYFQMMRPFPPAWSGTAKGCALPHRNPARLSMHLLERQAEQLRDAGVWPDAPNTPGSAPPPDLSWILRRQPEQRPVAGAVKPRPYVIHVPGGDDGKRWPEARFGEVAAQMRAAGFDNVIMGGPEQSALARYIQKFDPKARDLTGRSDFAQIAIVASKAALAIGNDTGQLHLIAAAGAPTLALFSKASDPVVNGPRGHVAVLQADDLAALSTDQVMRAARSLTPAPEGTA